MKKYVKPELFYERFELTQTIADCAWELNQSSEKACSAEADADYLPGFVNFNLFMSDAIGCVLIPGTNYEEYCYHDGVQGINVFNS